MNKDNFDCIYCIRGSDNETVHHNCSAVPLGRAAALESDRLAGFCNCLFLTMRGDFTSEFIPFYLLIMHSLSIISL